VFRQASNCAALDDGQLEQLLHQARSCNVLAMLAYHLLNQGVSEQLPNWFTRHLQSAIHAAAAVHRSVKWEIFNVTRALRQIDTPVLFLKGAAYILANNNAAAGRIFSDVDFLVPRQRIAEVEKALLNHGWVQGELSSYDDRYYRRWMHEVPPLKHIQRKSVLDVHHAILPPTAKAKPDSDLLIHDAQLLECEYVDGEIYVLSACDMFLHSATHLFYEGELEHGFRDMIDIMRLLTQYCVDNEYAENLVRRARELHLEKPLFYALRYCQALFALEFPAALATYVGKEPTAMVSKPWLPVMDWLFLRALRPAHSACDKIGSGLARSLLYIRGHYLRMPLYLLLPHLLRKALVREKH